MKNKIIKYSAYLLPILFLFLLAYNVTYAQPQPPPPPPTTSQMSFSGVITLIIDLFKNYVIKLIFALGIVYFMWGVVQYMLYPDEGEKKEKGKSMMIWGIIALTAMFSVWGLIRMTMNTFGLTDTVNTPINIPKIPTTN